MSAMSQNGLGGQRALVTGATSGIGRAVALQLARDGAEVLVHGRDAARGADTVEEITASGGKASFVAADLGDAADVQRLGSDVGDVDILINNAGIALFAPTGELDVDTFDKMFASNVRAPGRGVGSALMRPVLETCDRDGVPAYLEATSERNKRLYLRHGFEVTDEIRLPDGPTLWRMWRAPR